MRHSFCLERAIHGPIPILGETFDKLSVPLVHTDFPLKTRHQAIGPYEFPLKIIWANGSRISLKVLVYTGIGP